jgi:hypothetical protein
METNYTATSWRMPENANKPNVSNYSFNGDGGATGASLDLGNLSGTVLQPDNNHLVDKGFTVSLWIKANDLTQQNGLWQNDGSTASTYGGLQIALNPESSLGANDTKINIGYSTGSGTGSAFRKNFLTNTIGTFGNQWWHIVVVYKGIASNPELYLNGFEYLDPWTITGTGSSLGYTGTDSGAIGKNRNGNAAGCQITQVSCFNYGLDEDQVTALYNGGTPPNVLNVNLSPVAYWPLGERDVTNDPYYAQNQVFKSGDVFEFDFLSSSQITLDNETERSPDSSITFWFKGSAQGGNYGQVVYGLGSDLMYQYLSGNGTGGNQDLFIYDGTFYKIIDDFYDNEWHNVVITYDKTAQEVRGYKDGILNNTVGSINWTTDQFINYIAGRNGIRFLTGLLSHVAIFNRKLETADVNQIYNNGQPYSDLATIADCYGCWKFDSSSVWDASYPFGTGNWLIPDARSESSSSLYFNGSQYAKNPLVPSTDEVSVSFWIYRESGAFIDAISQAQESGILIWTPNSPSAADSVVGVYIQNGSPGNSATWQQYVSTDTIQQNKWNHIGVTIDKTSGNLQFYINGVKQAGAVSIGAGSIGWATNSTLEFGRYSTLHNFEGYMSNMCFWSSILTDSDMETLWNNGTPYSSPETVDAGFLEFCYKMDNANTENDIVWSYEIVGTPDTGSNDGMWVVDSSTAPTSSNSKLRWIDLNGDSSNYITWLGPSINVVSTGSHVFEAQGFAQGSGGTTQLEYEYEVNGSGTWTNIATVINTNFSGSSYTETQLISLTAGDTVRLRCKGFTYNSSSSYATSEFIKLTDGVTSLTIYLESFGDEQLNYGVGNGSSTLGAYIELNIIDSSPNPTPRNAKGLLGQTKNNVQPLNVSVVNGVSSGLTDGALVESDLFTTYNSEDLYSFNFQPTDPISISYVGAGDTLKLDSAYTVNMWFRAETLPSPVSYFLNKVNLKYALQANGGNLIWHQYAYEGGGGSNFSFTAIPIASWWPEYQNKWVNFTIVSTGIGGKLIVYLNGVKVNETNLPANYQKPNQGDSNLLIGGYSSGLYGTDGNISSVTAWNVALSPSEILDVYNNGFVRAYSQLPRLSDIKYSFSLNSRNSFYDANATQWHTRCSKDNTLEGIMSNATLSNMSGLMPGSFGSATGANVNAGIIDGSLKGGAPLLTKANAFSVNMDYNAKKAVTIN